MTDPVTTVPVSEQEQCPSTCGEGRERCVRPARHSGAHSGEVRVWWTGNGFGRKDEL